MPSQYESTVDALSEYYAVPKKDVTVAHILARSFMTEGAGTVTEILDGLTSSIEQSRKVADEAENKGDPKAYYEKQCADLQESTNASIRTKISQLDDVEARVSLLSNATQEGLLKRFIEQGLDAPLVRLTDPTPDDTQVQVGQASPWYGEVGKYLNHWATQEIHHRRAKTINEQEKYEAGKHLADGIMRFGKTDEIMGKRLRLEEQEAQRLERQRQREQETAPDAGTEVQIS